MAAFLDYTHFRYLELAQSVDDPQTRESMVDDLFAALTEPSKAARQPVTTDSLIAAGGEVT